MNMNEFQEMNNIVDPNVAKTLGSQENSTTTKRVVTPQQMGFTHEEPEKPARAEQSILDDMEKAIARKQNEARLMADAIDESGDEGISKDEFQDLLAQAEFEDNIPEEVVENTIPFRPNTSLPTENPAVNILDELDAEDEEDEAEYAEQNTVVEEEQPKHHHIVKPVEEVKPKPVDNVIDNPFKNITSGSIDFDQEDEDLDDDTKKSQEEEKKQTDRLKALIREKISPVAKSLDISTFTISNRPASNTINTIRSSTEKVADWVLMNSNKPITMKRFTGTEMERLVDGGKGRSRLNRALDTWQLIYEHIVDPNKPASVEEWARVTSFLDIDHIYMAMYRANFEGSNYIPYGCSNPDCKDKSFLSENFDIMDMCKFATDEDKKKFNAILEREYIPGESSLYSTEVVPISDDYAFVFREPSIYNIIFETVVLDEEFLDKFGDLISICSYIDGIYYINKEERILQPVKTNVYQNNMKKTVKSKIIKYSKIISTLDSDQYNIIFAYMQKINEGGNALTYVMPEVTCPSCNTTIEEKPTEAQQMVFIRHRLATIATL